ncbi:hypothetical protein LOTGIDRAFT_235010 [Lottia gigantea]|uniref:NADH dehydrogenase [ubiquinone] 1 alpha subcomplex subunit 11 n=1 Tax=Lottia gigantea TaxID=225164 RepID=V4A2J0_LOTGI|nr:hypothetical protein LOTGIDRAFT_235010 [Lottia gigantea]ESO87516.1 hypothetical protein LOTGIDRAFT_235010 [Lottia gigantea]
MMERKQKSTPFVRYNAFEIPADQYAFQKTINFGQLGGVIGFCLGIGNHLTSKVPPTAATTLLRIAIPVGVTAVTGITYGATLSALGALRGKDDARNHLFAGFCSGAIPGSMFKANRLSGAIYAGCFVGLCAWLIKLTYIRNGGKKRKFSSERIRNRQQFFPLKSDVETKPEYAKYFT